MSELGALIVAAPLKTIGLLNAIVLAPACNAVALAKVKVPVPNALLLPTTNVPPLTVVPPLYVLAPLNVNVPVPVTFNEPGLPLEFSITEEIDCGPVTLTVKVPSLAIAPPVILLLVPLRLIVLDP
ncbi:hypothetical protein FV185_12230 [Ferrovum sp. PN-J185]|nr:hypothetical protein FV185_12230 [Ferrovum sp. PN-J185]